MRRTFVEVAVAISLTLAAIFASATGVNASGVMVMDAFARASATPTAASGAAYISLMNHGAGQTGCCPPQRPQPKVPKSTRPTWWMAS